ncbi:hypothetical protein ACFSL6_07825 [Paenibacillus thailandensis]|uniref:Uncharacterized protein n=1 Tax=Paenibacillus thailandensis TaxID=393250 RepID=A0ABW5QVT1_9BACL
MSDHEVYDVIQSFGEEADVLTDQDYRQALRQFAHSKSVTNETGPNTNDGAEADWQPLV